MLATFSLILATNDKPSCICLIWFINIWVFSIIISMKSSLGKGFPSHVSSAVKAMLRPSIANLLVGSRSWNMKVGSIISFGIDTFYTFLN